MSKNPDLVVNQVLAVTRDQLNRAMAACAELEALLTIERQKNSELEQALEEAKKAGSKSND